MLPPGDEKMGHVVTAHDDESGECVRRSEQDVIDGDHDLLGFEPESVGDLLDGVDRSSVQIRLTSVLES
jgi:hypothetical protein